MKNIMRKSTLIWLGSLIAVATIYLSDIAVFAAGCCPDGGCCGGGMPCC